MPASALEFTLNLNDTPAPTSSPSFELRAEMHRHSGRFHWYFQAVDETAAQRVLPLDIPVGKVYIDAWLEQKHPADLIQSYSTCYTAFTTGVTRYRNEYRCFNRYGEERWLREEVELVLTEPDRWQATATCTDVTDVTAARNAEADPFTERERAAHLEGALQTIRTLQHEINNPLQALLLTLNLMERRLEPESRDHLQAHLHRLQEAALRIADVVQRTSRVNQMQTIPSPAGDRLLLPETQ